MFVCLFVLVISLLCSLYILDISLRANIRKNGNRQPREVGGWGGGMTLQNAPETWEVRDSQDSKGGTLDEMPDSRERELIEPTSSRKTGHQVRDGVAIPQSHL